MAASYSSISLALAERKTLISAYKKDKEFRDAFENQDTSDKFVKMDELLYPHAEQHASFIIASFHDSAIAAHPGIRRTFLRIVQWYYWKNMDKDIHDYVSSCETWARWKHSNAKKNGKMIPIPIPEECWEVVSMDFITGLPEPNGFDAIFTIVDKLSKRAKYVAVKTTDDAEKIAHVFFENIVCHHGMPAAIINDRDPKFTLHFWRSLAKIMGIKLNMNTR